MHVTYTTQLRKEKKNSSTQCVRKKMTPVIAWLTLWQDVGENTACWKAEAQCVCVGFASVGKVAAGGRKRHAVHQRSATPTRNSCNLSLSPLIHIERLAAVPFTAAVGITAAPPPLRWPPTERAERDVSHPAPGENRTQFHVPWPCVYSAQLHSNTLCCIFGWKVRSDQKENRMETKKAQKCVEKIQKVHFWRRKNETPFRETANGGDQRYGGKNSCTIIWMFFLLFFYRNKSITTTLGKINTSVIQAVSFFSPPALWHFLSANSVFPFVCEFTVHSGGTAWIARWQRLLFSHRPLMCKLIFTATGVSCFYYPTMNGCSLTLIHSGVFPLGNQASLTIPQHCQRASTTGWQTRGRARSNLMQWLCQIFASDWLTDIHSSCMTASDIDCAYNAITHVRTHNKNVFFSSRPREDGGAQCANLYDNQHLPCGWEITVGFPSSTLILSPPHLSWYRPVPFDTHTHTQSVLISESTARQQHCG